MEETQQQAQWIKITRKILTSIVSQKDGKRRGLCDYTTKAYNKNTDRQGCPAHLEF